MSDNVEGLTAICLCYTQTAGVVVHLSYLKLIFSLCN